MIALFRRTLFGCSPLEEGKGTARIGSPTLRFFGRAWGNPARNTCQDVSRGTSLPLVARDRNPSSDLRRDPSLPLVAQDRNPSSDSYLTITALPPGGFFGKCSF
jgi:hypothetical protein